METTSTGSQYCDGCGVLLGSVVTWINEEKLCSNCEQNRRSQQVERADSAAHVVCTKCQQEIPTMVGHEGQLWIEPHICALPCGSANTSKGVK